MLIIDSSKVKFEPLTKGNVKGVWVKQLINKDVGAEKFYMRIYKVEKGGNTNFDIHIHEHEVYVLKGKGVLNQGNKFVEIKEGDAIYIKSFEPHQFLNKDDEPLIFLCVRGSEKIY
ncbi:MAG: cupin domain-containing protein [Nitrososphaerales archaeon]